MPVESIDQMGWFLEAPQFRIDLEFTNDKHVYQRDGVLSRPLFKRTHARRDGIPRAYYVGPSHCLPLPTKA